MDKPYLKLRIILWAGLGVVTVFFLWTGLGLGGEVVYKTSFKNNKGMISRLSPKERLRNDKSLEIIGNPVYFSLQTPRQYSKAKLIYEYKNNSDSKIETGLLVDGALWRHKLKPIENKIIDELSKEWNEMRSEELILLQKNEKYEDINSFLKDPPKRDDMALYNYELDTNYTLDNYSPTSSVQKISTPLRGGYQFYTYIKDEDLKFNFDFLDLNKNSDSDPVDLNVYYRGKLITAEHLDDDGVADETGKIGDPGEIDLQTRGLPEGVYKIELRANDDIVTEKIETKQTKISFKNKIRIYEKFKGGKKIYTDSQELQSKIIKPANLQTLQINNLNEPSNIENFEINETYKQFETPLVGPGIHEIKLDKGGIIITGDGFFAFAEDSLINPSFKKVDESIIDSDVKYVLAKYNTPEQESGWSRASVDFDLGPAYREDNKYGFVISAPKIKVENGGEDSIALKNIRIKLEGKSLVEKIKEFLK